MPVDLNTVSLISHWTAAMWQPGMSEERFLTTYLPSVIPGSTAEDFATVHLCANGCGSWSWEGQMTEVPNRDGTTRWVCNRCARYLTECHTCHAMVTQTWAIGRYRYCVECRDEDFLYCRNCDLWYPPGEVAEHRHGAASCCESPLKQFTFPNGGSPLANDTRVEVQMEPGHVDENGFQQIRNEIQNYARTLGRVTYLDPESRQYRMYRMGSRLTDHAVGSALTDKSGNFATRVKRHAYKEFGLKLEPELLTRIGNIAADNAKGATYYVEVTRDLNLSAYEFGHGGSCWWTDYKGSRCSLKTNGGFGLRAFSAMGGNRVIGRCWVLPIRRDVDGNLAPTFSTKHLFFVFNGYGVLEERVAPRLVAHMVGRPWKALSFNSDRAEGMYINNDSGWLVGDQSVLDKWDRLDVTLPHHSNLYETEREHAHV